LVQSRTRLRHDGLLSNVIGCNEDAAIGQLIGRFSRISLKAIFCVVSVNVH